jgi:hypothetical protein
MRWIFENPQLLLLIAGAVAYWLNERRKSKETQKEIEQELDREPTDDEMAERTRRIQEEIRRKIEERQGRPVPPALPRSAPAPTRTETPAPPPLPRPELASRPAPLVATAEAGTGAAELELVMEQQRRYADQLRQLESLSRTAPTAVNVAAASSFATAGSAPAPARRGLDLIPALHDRDALRRAILLREVLGPAKGLQ